MGIGNEFEGYYDSLWKQLLGSVLLHRQRIKNKPGGAQAYINQSSGFAGYCRNEAAGLFLSWLKFNVPNSVSYVTVKQVVQSNSPEEHK